MSCRRRRWTGTVDVHEGRRVRVWATRLSLRPFLCAYVYVARTSDPFRRCQPYRWLRIRTAFHERRSYGSAHENSGADIRKAS